PQRRHLRARARNLAASLRADRSARRPRAPGSVACVRRGARHAAVARSAAAWNNAKPSELGRMTLHRHLCVESIAGGFDPHGLLASFADRPHVALLENPGPPTPFGRYSYICTDPFWVFRSKRERVWSGPPGAER